MTNLKTDSNRSDSVLAAPIEAELTPDTIEGLAKRVLINLELIETKLYGPTESKAQDAEEARLTSPIDNILSIQATSLHLAKKILAKVDKIVEYGE